MLPHPLVVGQHLAIDDFSLSHQTGVGLILQLNGNLSCTTRSPSRNPRLTGGLLLLQECRCIVGLKNDLLRLLR